MITYNQMLNCMLETRRCESSEEKKVIKIRCQNCFENLSEVDGRAWGRLGASGLGSGYKGREVKLQNPEGTGK